MVVFQALTWESRDAEDEHLVSIFGRTEDGRSVCVTTPFAPYFFIKLNKFITPELIFKQLEEYVSFYQIMKCKDLWGFQNNEECKFMKLNFDSLEKMKKCDRKLRYPMPGQKFPYKVYEANVEPVLRLMHRTGIQSTGWLDSGKCQKSCLAKTDIDLMCTDWKTLKPVERDDLAPFIIGSFDIEANSSTGKFPNPDIHGDSVFQIAISLRRQGHPEIFDKTCLCYKETEKVEDGNVVWYSTEREMLVGFSSYLNKMDVDILTGWNIFGFDLEFIHKRAQLLGCPIEFYELGKLRDNPSPLVEKKLSSNALGDNTLKLVPMAGRFIFDLFHEVKREQKLDSYSLNAVSQHFLGDTKIDMSPKEMFKRFIEEDPYKLAEVAEYCIKDTLLPHFLMDKLCNIMNLLEMAKATWVPLSYLSERGQQIKVFSQITRKARELGFMVPTIRWGQIEPTAYEGATVLEAQIGAYYVPITALDFEGLYPSIMIAHNLCYSTLVLDSKYENIPGVKYEKFVINGKTHKFAQDVPSLLPLILTELKQFRKQAKKDMAAASGQMKQVYNGKQLAYKVSMNSVYGFTGASKGILPCVPIAATVTCEGRHMIEQTKELVEREFKGSHVRYGDTDSVMVEFDMQGRVGQEALDYSWKLGEEAAIKCNTLFKNPKNLELEKVYWPYILYSKKRYAAKMWTQDKSGEMKMDCIDVKGLQLVRRDNIPFVREVSKEILNIILESKDAESAKNLAHSKAVELLDGRVPLEKLILSQKLSDSYKGVECHICRSHRNKKECPECYNGTIVNLPHVRVRNNIHKRSPGSEPQSGDRVPFVIIETKNKTQKQFEKSEDPKWVKEHNIKLDYCYYFTNKFMTPICDLLEPLIADPQEKLFGDLLRQTKAEVKFKSLGCRKIDDLFAAYNSNKKETLNNNKNVSN